MPTTNVRLTGLALSDFGYKDREQVAVFTIRLDGVELRGFSLLRVRRDGSFVVRAPRYHAPPLSLARMLDAFEEVRDFVLEQAVAAYELQAGTTTNFPTMEYENAY